MSYQVPVTLGTKATVRLADVIIRLLVGLIVVLLAADWAGGLDWVGEIPVSSIRPMKDHGYQVLQTEGVRSRWDVAIWFYADGDSNGSPRASPLRLFEDGRVIGKPHSIHQEIDEKGGGLYSHWAGSLLFSTSDNSDPRRNGRRYSFDLPPDAWRLVLLPGLLLLGLIGWRQWRGLAAGLPEIRLAAAGLGRMRQSHVIRYAVRRRRVVCYAASLAVAAYFVGCYAFGSPPMPLIAPDSSTYWGGRSIVPIGYPAFLWTIYGIFGKLHAVIIAQAALFSAAVIAVQTGIERVTTSSVFASATAIALLAFGAAPSTAIWLLSESVFTSLLLFHVAMAGWAFMVPTRRNLVALAFTAVLPISVRPAGYFLIGGVLFLMLFWAGQRRMILYWGLCPLIALLIILYGLDHTIQGRASISHAGANLFPHVARLYDRPPAGLPPEIAAETQGPILKSYQLAQKQSANWQDRHALEENNFNLILNELGNTIKRKLFLAPGQTLRDLSQSPQAVEQRAKKFEKFLLDLALYTIKEHPIGYLQTVLENLAAWYVEYVFYNAPDTGDRLAREYDQFWPAGQEFMSNFGIPPITVTLSEATTDYLLTRPEALSPALQYVARAVTLDTRDLSGIGSPRDCRFPSRIWRTQCGVSRLCRGARVRRRAVSVAINRVHPEVRDPARPIDPDCRLSRTVERAGCSQTGDWMDDRAGSRISDTPTKASIQND